MMWRVRGRHFPYYQGNTNVFFARSITMAACLRIESADERASVQGVLRHPRCKNASTPGASAGQRDTFLIDWLLEVGPG